MTSSSAIRLQIETALAQKIPSALTPAPKMVCPVAGTGIGTVDEILEGGLPIGAISELVGPECSGRTSVALSFLARMTQMAKVCAWIDVSNAFDPLSASAAGVDLARLLWVRCGVLQRETKQPSRRFVLPGKYLVPLLLKRCCMAADSGRRTGFRRQWAACCGRGRLFPGVPNRSALIVEIKFPVQLGPNLEEGARNRPGFMRIDG
jgi:recA bacterial DNA recombination protein